MEIEAKFQINDPQVFEQLLGLTELAGFRLHAAAEAELQRNTYFDTADGRLRAHGYGMRIRDLGTRRIATLKGNTQRQGALHQRNEWEVELGQGEHPLDWPASEARELALQLLAGAAPLPILQILTTRRHLYAYYNQQLIAEISLDDVVIHAGRRQQAFCELEIEQIATTDPAVFNRLVDVLRQRFALHAEPRSKLARGLALLQEEFDDHNEHD